MSVQAPRGPSRRGLAVAGAAIAAAAAWTMAPALRGTWLWDDDLEVVRSAAVRAPSGWWRAWVSPVGMDYLPLKDTALWAQWRLWGGRAEGFHLVNLALHIVAALLVWRVLRQLFAEAETGLHPGASAFGAWLGGLLFAVHPVTVGSVAWIAEFQNTLSLPLLLGSFLAYLRWDEERDPRVRRLAWVLFAASLLAKSSGVMLPGLMLLHALWRRGRLGREDGEAVLPFAGLSLACAAVTIGFQTHRAIGLNGPLPPFSLRLAQSGWSLAADAAECVLPWRLAPVYAPVHAALPPLLPWVVAGAVIGLCLWRRDGWGRSLLFGLGWFLLNLQPVLGLIPLAYLRVAPRADHFLYLPLVGVVGLAGAAAAALASSGWARRTVTALAAAGAVAALAAEAHAYAETFRSPESLWSTAVRRTPQAWLARSNFGRVLLDEGRVAEAETHLREAVRLEPDSAEARANWGNALASLGQTAQAEEELTAAVRLDPRLAGADYDLGILLVRTGRYREAEDRFRAALALDPGYARAHNNLGLALAHQGRREQATAAYEAALRLDPALTEAWLNLGNASAAAGRFEAAVDQYRRALALEPGYAAAHHNLGYALERLGRFAEARTELDAAVKLAPAK